MGFNGFNWVKLGFFGFFIFNTFYHENDYTFTVYGIYCISGKL